METFLSKKEIDLNNPIAKKHVPQAERCIRDLKNRIRCARMLMPFKKIPRAFTIEIVKQATVLTSSLVRKNNNIHPILSPRTLITGFKIKMPGAQVGQYVQAHIGGDNSVEKERTCDALYIGRCDNGNGHRVFKLSTRQTITCNKISIIPMTTDHID